MYCSLCGMNNCLGSCLNGTLGIQSAQQGASANWYPLSSGQSISIGQQSIALGYPNISGISSITSIDIPLANFLDIIADRTDTDACVAFVEQQFKLRAAQQQELERMKQRHQENLDRTEKEFLSKCLKYRPSINPEVMERVKKLKAFF